MRIQYSRRALQNLNDIFEYLHGENPQAADRVAHAIETTVNLLASFPSLGKSKTGRTRKLVSHKYGYRIYYRLRAGKDEIEIVAIRHPKRAGI